MIGLITSSAATTTRALNGSYENIVNLKFPFATYSYYLTPWRGYMDTWPAYQWPNKTFGLMLGDSTAQQPGILQLANEFGFSHIRSGPTMGQLTYANPDIMNGLSALNTTFTAYKRAGLRPLVLLNSNSGLPAPFQYLSMKLNQSASAGATVLHVTGNFSQIKLRKTGLMGQAYQAAFPLIVAYDQAAGTVTLSAPLLKPISAGNLILLELLWAPLALSYKYSNGTDCPFVQESLDGWMEYVNVTLTLAQNLLGTQGKSDVGFDVEVWNELSFGSQWLTETSYYNPAPTYQGGLTYTNTTLGMTYTPNKPFYVLLPMTVDFVANNFPGARVIDGFSNTLPWATGAAMWPRQTGYSQHTYTGWQPTVVSPSTVPQYSRPFNALGGIDGVANASNTQGLPPGTPGTWFVPNYTVACPESNWLYYGGNPWFNAMPYMYYDIMSNVPYFQSYVGNHGRYGRPAQNSQSGLYWNTETNMDRTYIYNNVLPLVNNNASDPTFITLMSELAAKAALRLLTFYSHKGVDLIILSQTFATPSDSSINLLPTTFYSVYAANNYQVNDAVRAAVGPVFQVVRNLAKVLDNSTQAIDIARTLSVTSIVEHNPVLVFAGDGTAAHPDRYNVDYFAVMPWQQAPNRFVIGFYVATLDMNKVWNTSASPLSMSYYNMPQQQFDLTLGNIRGTGASVYVYDPLLNTYYYNAAILSGNATSLTVAVQAVDYPRFLVVQEATNGPLVLNPIICTNTTHGANNQTVVYFTTNVPTFASVMFGEMPSRSGFVHSQSARSSSFTFALNQTLNSTSAIQITVTDTNGVTAQWPRWLADPRGQVPAAGLPACSTYSFPVTSIILDPSSDPTPSGAPEAPVTAVATWLALIVVSFVLL